MSPVSSLKLVNNSYLIILANKIANDFWESKLGEMNFEKLQNDENRLYDFIKDKYERKRYVPKGKDPMTLIYEGKEPEVVEPKKSRNSSEDSDR